jgi:hypothetical protein
MVQTAHTAIANARAPIHQRLARWILMAHDRTSDNTLPLTHEFLSLMLGVRRAGVTEAERDEHRATKSDQFKSQARAGTIATRQQPSSWPKPFGAVTS